MRRIVPLRTVALESPADLQAFREALSKRFRLPRIRITLRLSKLAEARRAEHERLINRLLATRGWAGAALCALLPLGLTLLYPLSPAGADTSSAIAAWAAQGVLGLLLGGAAGALAGRGLARQRLRALCARIEAELGLSAQG
jgi:hypothetical protein